MPEIDKDKIDAVYKYLSSEFPKSSHPIIDRYDEDRFEQSFIIDRSGIDFIVRITKVCWDTCDANTLFEHLKNLDIAKVLLNNPDKIVIVNESSEPSFRPK